jgi:hypothetical protein
LESPSGASRDFVSDHADEINARRLEIYGDPKDRPDWTAERDELRRETRSVVEKVLLRFHSEDVEDRVVNRIARDLYPYLRLMHEAGGFLPQRVQAQLAVTPVTSCIAGSSCECGEGCDQAKPWPGLRAQAEPESVHDSPSSPVSPPGSVPAEFAGTEAVAREIERDALAIVDALKHRATMHRDEILRPMPGDNTPAGLAKALEKGYVTEDDRGQVRLGPVPVPALAPVPARFAGKNPAA